jgi:predicted phage baseplate assembly protein
VPEVPLALPDLDTRRFEELVVEARSRIPVHAPQWTDHNVSDPGIVLIELLAYLAESDVYRANRVPDRNRRKLLALLGGRAAGPSAGRAVLAATRRAGGPDSLPAGLELMIRHGDAVLPATTLAELPLVDGAVRAVQVMTADAIADATTRLATTRAVPALGPDPVPGCALAIGLDEPLPAGRSLTLHLDLDGPFAEKEDAAIAASGLEPKRHHGARTVWDVFDGTSWTQLPDAAVSDPTRALTRPGVVVLTPPQVDRARLGTVVAELAWIRCRLADGRPDRAPVLHAATANAVAVRFASPSFTALSIAAGANVPPTGAITAGSTQALALEGDAATGAVTRVAAAGADDAPAVAILDYLRPTPTKAGRIALEAAFVGHGDGTPEQVFTLAGAPVLDDARVWLLEHDGVHAVRLRDDLDASGRRDRDAVLDCVTGVLRFGDGRRGRVPPAGAAILAAWQATSAGAATALRPPATARLSTSQRNRLLLGGDDPSVVDGLVSFAMVTPVHGAADAEDVAVVAARAERRTWAHERLVAALEAARATTLDELDPAVVATLAVPERAVTLADHERIALATAGARIARARAFVDMHPATAPDLRAAGCVTVVVVPGLPAACPQPTDGLLDAIARTLAPRRLVATRVFVTGPTYVGVDVTATISTIAGCDAAVAIERVDAALCAFLHPLDGGPDGRGWPFGRAVYRSEVMQLIDGVEGVDHVEQLTLGVAGEPPTCGNLEIARVALVVAGTRLLEVAA